MRDWMIFLLVTVPLSAWCALLLRRTFREHADELAGWRPGELTTLAAEPEPPPALVVSVIEAPTYADLARLQPEPPPPAPPQPVRTLVQPRERPGRHCGPSLSPEQMEAEIEAMRQAMAETPHLVQFLDSRGELPRLTDGTTRVMIPS